MPSFVQQTRAALLPPSLIPVLWGTLASVLASAQAAPTPAAPHLSRIPDDAVNQKVHIQGDFLSLPLILVKGYPFLEGEINGTEGKLLFDIGADSSFVLNSHRVTPPDGKVVGNGSFSSGQTFSVSRFPVVDSLKLAGGPEYTAIENVLGNTGLQLEQHITSDFIGWIGLHWFQGYLFKLDYAKPGVSFYQAHPASASDSAAMQEALRGEKVTQVIHFNNVGHPNYATLPVHIGTHTFLASFDTGSHNVLWLTPELRDQMKAEGLLHQQGDGSFQLANVSIDGHLIDLNSHVEIDGGKASKTKLLGETTDPLMTLGYEFLSKFRTVWDYEHSTVTLLEK